MLLPIIFCLRALLLALSSQGLGDYLGSSTCLFCARPFAPWPQGLSEVPPHMNDANKEEPSRYSALKECAHVVDLDLDAQAEPSVVRDAGGAWERVRCAPFLDAAASTSTLARAFYVPGLSDKRNVYAEYCLVRRR